MTSWERDQRGVEAASRATAAWPPGSGVRPDLGDLQVLISNMVIGNCRPAGRRNSTHCKPCRSPPGEGHLFLFGSVLLSSYCVAGLGPALLRELAGRVGRGRGWNARVRAVSRAMAREPEKLHQDLGAELRAQFQKDLLAPPTDKPARCTRYTEMNYATAPAVPSFLARGKPASHSGVTVSQCCNRGLEAG